MLLFTFLFNTKLGVWGALFFTIQFMLIGLIKENGFEFVTLFNALYGILMNSFLGYIVAFPLEYLFSFTNVSTNFLYLTVAILPPVVNYLVINALELWFPEYSLKSLRNIHSVSMAFLIIVLTIIMGILYIILTIENQAIVANKVHNSIILILFLVVVSLLLLLNAYYQRQRKKEIQFLKDEQMVQLQDYTKHIEVLYEEINHFKHDYINILTSLEDGVKSQDIQSIKEIYESVIEPTKQTFQTNHFMIARLSNVLIPEIKSLVSAKLLIAEQEGIDIQIEVVEPIENLNMDLINLIRMISIFLDNAIEAAKLTQKPWIKMALIRDDNSVTIIIENSSSESVNIGKISEKGYSSKGMGRGIGLYTVQRLLKKEPNVFIETSSSQQSFSQLLKIVGDSE